MGRAGMVEESGRERCHRAGWAAERLVRDRRPANRAHGCDCEVVAGEARPSLRQGQGQLRRRLGERDGTWRRSGQQAEGALHAGRCFAVREKTVVEAFELPGLDVAQRWWVTLGGTMAKTGRPR